MSSHLSNYNNTMNEPLSAWFNDGSVTYGVDDHFVLTTVTSVIVGMFLIFYMIIILTSGLQMKSNKIRGYLWPIYEAVYVPYEYKTYWFYIYIYIYITYIMKVVSCHCLGVMNTDSSNIWVPFVSKLNPFNGIIKNLWFTFKYLLLLTKLWFTK